MQARIVLVTLLLLGAGGCAPVRRGVRARFVPEPAARKGPTGDWDQLGRVEPGRQVAVYLDSGRRVVQAAQRGGDLRDVLDLGAARISREEVVAVAVASRDRLLDGVLIGASSGAGIMLGWGAALGEDDLDGGAAAVASVFGVAAGAGVGAMFDAGLAAPEQPVYIRPAAGQAASTARRWHLTIAPERVAGWIAGRRVEMMLTDGTYLKGTVARADTRSIEVAVGDSSEKSYRKRRVEVSVDRLAAVTYRENVGGNRFAATLAGALTGLCAGALAASAPASDSADEKPLVFGGGAGVMAGGLTGFGLARHYNSREITLSVVRSRP